MSARLPWHISVPCDVSGFRAFSETTALYRFTTRALGRSPAYNRTRALALGMELVRAHCVRELRKLGIDPREALAAELARDKRRTGGKRSLETLKLANRAPKVREYR